MKNTFKNLPNTIKRQIITKGILGGCFLIAFVLLLIFVKNFVFAVPCLGMAIFFAYHVFVLLYDYATNNLIVLQGECLQIEKKRLSKRIDYILFQVEEKQVKVSVRHQLKHVQSGDTITMYLSTRTSVYENGNMLTVCDYYAIEVNTL